MHGTELPRRNGSLSRRPLDAPHDNPAGRPRTHSAGPLFSSRVLADRVEGPTRFERTRREGYDVEDRNACGLGSRRRQGFAGALAHYSQTLWPLTARSATSGEQVKRGWVC